MTANIGLNQICVVYGIQFRKINWVWLVWIEIVQGILNFSELFGANVGIYFGGFSAGVPQDLLDVAKVYYLFKEMGGKWMSEHMRSYSFLNTV